MNDVLKQEIETLEAIYGDALKILPPDAEKRERIRLSLTSTPSDDVDGATAEPSVACELTLSFTSNYPNELPHIHLRPIRGLTVNQAANVKHAVDQEAKRNVGELMVFALATVIKDMVDGAVEGYSRYYFVS